ncbi:MAG: Hsp20/alpha crystallin family protein [Nanoarchaeota archaeon]
MADFFGEKDPFEDLIREFFGPRRGGRERETIIKGEEEDRIIDFIETGKHIFIVFELPGYDEKDISIDTKGKELMIKASKSEDGGVQEYLMSKLKHGILIKKILPPFVDAKKFSHTMKNGVLELKFEKKK